MNPLIEITTVPIEIKMTTKNATLEYTRGTAEMEIRRSDNGKADIKTRSITVQRDSFEPRGGGRIPSVVRGTSQTNPTQTGKRQTAYEVTGTFASQGELLVNAKVGQELVSQFTGMEQPVAAPAQNLQSSGTAAVSYETQASSENSEAFELEDADMEIRYEMDKTNFDWKLEQGEFKFTPGDIEFTVEQQPDVIIKYVGGPIYVPPSSDPNYEPVDVKA